MNIQFESMKKLIVVVENIDFVFLTHNNHDNNGLNQSMNKLIVLYYNINLKICYNSHIYYHMLRWCLFLSWWWWWIKLSIIITVWTIYSITTWNCHCCWWQWCHHCKWLLLICPIVHMNWWCLFDFNEFYLHWTSLNLLIR